MRALRLLVGTPPCRMVVTAPSRSASFWSLRMGSWMWRSTMRRFWLSRQTLPASELQDLGGEVLERLQRRGKRARPQLRARQTFSLLVACDAARGGHPARLVAAW